jgi:uncharacterized membrane protein
MRGGNIVNNSAIRASARKMLSGNWLNPILAGLSIIAVQLISMVLQAILPTVLSPILALAVFLGATAPISFGIIMFYLKFVRGKNPEPAEVKEGYQFWSKSIIAMFLVSLYTWLWSLLLIIPGIIKACSYSMTYFILIDNPDLTPSEAITKSKEMMNGYKSQFFFLGLSFIGWIILSTLTLGIGYIWLIPYMTTSFTVFYESLNSHNIK